MPALSARDGIERLGKLLDFETFVPPGQDADTDRNLQSTNDNNQDAKGNEEEQEQEFEFRLFSAPAKRTTDSTNAAGTGDDKTTDGGRDAAGAGIQKLRIRLRSPTPVPGEGKFVVPFRGWQYYVTAPELLSEKPSAEWSERATLKRKEYEDVAVTGAQLLEWAKGSWVSHFFSFPHRSCGLSLYPPWMSYCSVQRLIHFHSRAATSHGE